MRVINSTSDDESPVVHQTIPSIRVAFATSDLQRVDEHFGSATRLAFYRVDARSAELLEVAEFTDTKHDGNENKLVEKFKTLENTQAVFSLAIGASAVRQLIALEIQPIKLGDASPINEVLEFLQAEIEAGQTPWIRKALGPKLADPENRLGAYLEQGWEE